MITAGSMLGGLWIVVALMKLLNARKFDFTDGQIWWTH